MDLRPFFTALSSPVFAPFLVIAAGIVVLFVAATKIDRAGGHANLRLPGILVGVATIGYGLLLHFTATP